jgi:threonine dehydratase
VILRDLVRSGQLMRFELRVIDQPGSLATIATLLGEQGANVVDIGHDRMSPSLSPKGAVLSVTVELQGSDHAVRLLDVLRARQFEPTVTAIR